MANLEKDLIQKINRGTSFVLLGAGASVDSGYPTWAGLAKLAIEQVAIGDMVPPVDLDLIRNSFGVGDLIGTFQEIANRIGKASLVSLVEQIFSRVSPRDSEVYSKVSRWPFQVYLTTNYDDMIKRCLSGAGTVFIEKGNSLSDFRTFRADSTGVIFKIHGDFRDPNGLILTKDDYDRLRTDPAFAYWREKVYSVLHMCNLVIIGYSAKDPNFSDQLERAKSIADPENPVYMFAADLSPEEISRLYIENNVRIIAYDNRDGNHQGLKRLLRQYDSFICKRNSSFVGQPVVDSDEAEIASSVYFYNEVVFKNNHTIAKSLYNVILNELHDSSIGLPVGLIDGRLQSRGVINDTNGVMEAIQDLVEGGYAQKDIDTQLVSLTEKGADIVESARARNLDARQKFLAYCDLYIQRAGTNLDSERIIRCLNEAIVGAFKKRGFEIARLVHDGLDVQLYTSTDLVEEIERSASILEGDEFEVFTDLFLEILQRPAIEVRNYLALLCNGYFSYHILGHESGARKVRLAELKRKNLIVDSSILIPLLAKECGSNEYASNLVRELKNSNIQMAITDRLLYEVSEHADWALRHFRHTKFDDPEFLKATLGIGYKQNLFIDGSIKWSLGRGLVTFGDYMDHCLGPDSGTRLMPAIKALLAEHNISLENLDELPNFTHEKYSEYEAAKEKIARKRKERGSYRSELQCETEAELVVISSLKPFNFLTHSKNLKEITSETTILHWSPEVMFRFISLNSEQASLSSLYSCMMEDFYDCGFNIVNREVLQAFTNPLFQQSRQNLEEQKKNLGSGMEKFVNDQSIRRHENDFTLPFYSLQTAFHLASQAKIDRDAAVARMEELEKSKSLSETQKSEYYKLKNQKKSRIASTAKKKKRSKKGKKK